MYTYHDLKARFRKAPKALRGLQANFNLSKDTGFKSLSDVLIQGFPWYIEYSVGYWNVWYKKLVREEPITKYRFEKWNGEFIGMGEIGDFWELCEEQGANREMTMYEAYLHLPISDQHYNVDESWKEHNENN